MNCPRCKQELTTHAKFCNQCGLSISSEMNAATLLASGEPAKNITPQEQVATRVSTTPVSVMPTANRIIEGKYELLELLGEGGMGSVYRARRLRIGDYVAIKVLHEKYVTEESALERFRREAQAAAGVHHPNIVGIYDYGEEPDKGISAFIVMELVSGKPLRDIIEQEKRLSYKRAVSLIQTACAGVGAAHRRHIVHRDIKPDNFMVLPPESEGDSEIIKVVDFGIAKLRDIAGVNNLTQTGIVMGTPYYMSPEQCRGDSLDSRSDVYSLGATLYEMIAGNPPFTAPTVTGVVAKHLTEQPPALPSTLGVPPALEAVIRRALAKDPNARQTDAIAFAKELQTALSASATVPILAPTTTPNTEAVRTEVWGGSTNQAPFYPQPTQQAAPFPTRQPVQYTQPAAVAQKKPFGGMLFINIVAAVVVVGVLGGGVWWALQSNRSETTSSSPNYPAPANNANTGSSSASNPNSATAPPPVKTNTNNRNETPQTTPTTPNSLPTNPPANTQTPPPQTEGYIEQKILNGERINPAELAGLPKLRLRLLRNTVYARHGRTFDSVDLQVYFSKQAWYKPNPGFKDSMMTANDKANVETIGAEEKRR
jgi:eukaryotic-like serine/threonine-protein kinase